MFYPADHKKLLQTGSYRIMFSENRIVVKKSNDRPPRKMISAMPSKKMLLLLMPRIDKKEKMQLAINRMMATTVISSMMDVSDLLSTFNEVSTIKQIPTKLDEAFKICGDFSFCSFMVTLAYDTCKD